jgi:hypothetical protein
MATRTNGHSKATPELVAAKLDTLANLQDERSETTVAMEEAIDAVLPAKIRQKIAAIKERYGSQAREIDARVSEVTTQIRVEVLSLERSVKGQRLHAVYSQGRRSWDADKLDGYAVANPEILAFRSEGDPSVSVRKIG